MTNISPVMASALAPFISPSMGKYRVHYSHNGAAAEIDVYAFSDGHAWDKGRVNAARREMCGCKEIKIGRVDAI